MSIGHVVGTVVEVGVLSACNYIVRTPGVCTGASIVAHETTEVLVDTGLIEGIKVGVFNAATSSKIDLYKLAFQISGSIVISVAIGPVGFVAGTAISYASGDVIGSAYDWAIGTEHKHAHNHGHNQAHTTCVFDHYKLGIQISVTTISMTLLPSPYSGLANLITSLSFAYATGLLYDAVTTGHDHDHSHASGDTPNHAHEGL
jgi:hypothetical protein